MEFRKQKRRKIKRFIILNVILAIALVLCYLTAFAGCFYVSLAVFTVCAIIISVNIAWGAKEYEEYKD